MENISRYNNYRKYRHILEEMGIKYLNPDGEEPKRLRGAAKKASRESGGGGGGSGGGAAGSGGSGVGMSADAILSALSSTVGSGGAAGKEIS